MRVRFGHFVFDGAARELTRDGDRLGMSAKAFGLLECLLTERPRALSRAELSDRVWPGTAVGYTSLAAVVSEVRRLLGDEPRRPRFVRTVQRFGYAFCGAASDEGVGAGGPVFECSLAWEGREIGLSEGENLIGRQEGCTIRIDSPKVSRHHARIVVEGRSATLENLGSKNGTFLGGRRLEGAVPLAAGDTIMIGGAVLAFRARPSEKATTVTA